MAEFRVGEHTYRSRKLNARQQLHVVRRLGPVLGPMIQLALMPSSEDPDEMERQMAIAIPFLDAVAKMPEEDVNYVINVCMSVTQRMQGGNGSGPTTWAEVWNVAAQREMFEDIDMGTLLQITWNVVQDNLGGFSAIRQTPSVARDTNQTQLPPASAG